MKAIRTAIWHNLAIVGLMACCLLSGCRQKPVTVVLTYQVVPKPNIESAKVDPNEIVSVMRDRVGRRGHVSLLPSGEIQVGLFGNVDDEELAMFRRVMTGMGVLEFRIVASSLWKDDEKIIERAHKLGPDNVEVKIDDLPVARWVLYDDREFVPDDERIVTRLAGNALQALVLLDGINVTGNYLKSVSEGLDERGGPAINFSFDKRGAAAFGVLTSRNKPRASGAVRHLGIILDGRLLSAPQIRETIRENGQISGGSMDRREVGYIIDVLKAGALPAAIREISVTEVEAK